MIGSLNCANKVNNAFLSSSSVKSNLDLPSLFDISFIYISMTRFRKCSAVCVQHYRFSGAPNPKYFETSSIVKGEKCVIVLGIQGVSKTSRFSIFHPNATFQLLVKDTKIMSNGFNVGTYSVCKPILIPVKYRFLRVHLFLLLLLLFSIPTMKRKAKDNREFHI